MVNWSDALLMDRSGWVYVLTNPSLPGFVKVGFTRTSLEKRVFFLNIFQNSLPGKTPFELAYSEWFDDCLDAEKGAHYLLTEHRHLDVGPEMFRVSVDDAKVALTKLKELGTGGWKPSPNAQVVMKRATDITRISKRIKRFRNPSLYEWLVENYDKVKEVIGDDNEPDDFGFSRARTLWIESLPAGYKGKVSTPLGLMMEWKRVCKEVAVRQKFGDRDVMWEVRNAARLPPAGE